MLIDLTKAKAKRTKRTKQTMCKLSQQRYVFQIYYRIFNKLTTLHELIDLTKTKTK